MVTFMKYAVFTIIILLIQAICFSTWKNNNKQFLCNTDHGTNSNRALAVALEESRSSAKVKTIPITPFNFSHVNDDDNVEPRIWTPWPEDLKLPCPPAEPRWWHSNIQRKPTRRGLLFVKEMKTGSSTIGGIVLRLARQLPKRYGYDFEQCSTRIDHSSAGPIMHYNRRIMGESLLFSFLREPSARFMSQFYHFQVSREKIQPSDKSIQHYFAKYGYFQDYYLNDLSLSPYPPAVKVSQENKQAEKKKFASAILRDYDFIGITERMDESLVVLQLLLHLPTSDILHLNAKSKGSFDDGAFNRTCVYIVPTYVSPSMKQWFSSSTMWNRLNYGDMKLYQAANRSLDLTIEALGRELVQKKLKKFKEAQKFARDKCSNNLRLPCSADGIRAKLLDTNKFDTDCLWLDSGCGYKCLDEISEQVDRM